LRFKFQSAVTGLALAAAAAFGIAKPASATPATLGFYPGTDIYGPGNFHFDFDTYSKSATSSIATTAGITYGLGPDNDNIFGRTEIGFDYNFTNVPSAAIIGGTPVAGNQSVSAGKRLLFNFKTQLYNNNDSQTRVVAGGWGLGDSDFNPNYLYVAGSKNFKFGRVHLGAARALSKDIVGDDRTSLFLAYDKLITPKLQFVADYYSGKGNYAVVQPTLYYFFNDKADFGLGYARFNNKDFSPRNQIYICFDYNFDFKGNPAPAPENVTPVPAAN
jgi:hypothetical protein